MKNGYLIIFLQEVGGHSSFFTKRITLGAWERLFKVIGVLRSSSFSFLCLLLYPLRFSLFCVGEEDGLHIEDVDVNGMHKWSLEQLLKNLGNGFHLFFGLDFFPNSSICKP